MESEKIIENVLKTANGIGFDSIAHHIYSMFKGQRDWEQKAEKSLKHSFRLDERTAKDIMNMLRGEDYFDTGDIELQASKMQRNAETTIQFQDLPTQVKVKKSEHYSASKRDPHYIFDIILKNKNGTWMIKDGVWLEHGFYQHQKGEGWATNMLGHGTSQGDLSDAKVPSLYGRKKESLQELVNDEEKLKRQGFELEKIK